MCVVSAADDPELAAAAASSDQCEQSGSDDRPPVPKTPPPSELKTPSTTDSPGRRAMRSRFKLAANFSFSQSNAGAHNV